MDGSVGIIVAAHTSLCSNHIYKMGSDEQRAALSSQTGLRRMARLLVADRARSGSATPPARVPTPSSKTARGCSTASKTFTTNAHYADLCVAMAVTDRAAAQHGISAFAIEKDTPGFRCGKKENKLGLRASATGEVIFETAASAPSSFIGKLNEGFVAQPEGARWRTHLHRRARHRHGAGRYDAALTYSKAAQTVRPPDFGVPSDPAQAGGYGGGDRCRPPAQLSRRPGCSTAACASPTNRPWPSCSASEAAVRDRQRGRADSRRLRLHQGLPGGEVLPRREAVHHRGRHQRDPAHWSSRANF